MSASRRLRRRGSTGCSLDLQRTAEVRHAMTVL
jgi:hypothetical protein